MHRFVGMVVILIPEHILGRLLEELLQIGKHRLAAAHKLDHTLDIVRHEPPLLIGVALDTSVPLGSAGIFGPRGPAAVGAARTEPPLLLVEYVAVCLPLHGKRAFVIALAQRRRKTRDAPVGIAVLQRIGDTLVGGRISQIAVTEALRRVDGITVCLIDIISADTLCIGIRKHRQRRIAEHAP